MKRGDCRGASDGAGGRLRSVIGPRTVRQSGAPAGSAGACRRFLRETRAGAAAIAAAAVTVMSVGGAALIIDHLWLVDQRDRLKTAADSSSIAATHAMNRMLEADSTASDATLKAGLGPIVRRYVLLNLAHLSAERLTRAKDTLVIELSIDRAASRVVVAAKADLGGTLFARALPLLGNYAGPGTMSATATVECAGSAVEVVLALDVTASMHGKVDNNLPATGDNRRLNAVIKAAKGLVEELRATCDGRSVAVGIVPWDKTVRVPNAATWRQNNWVNMGDNRTGTIPTDWAGCVEDREHDANPLNETALASATSLSLDLPGTSPFPVFIYPDTKGFSVTPMANEIKADFPDLTDAIKDALETRLEALRENDYVTGTLGPRGRGGRNFNCTSTGMLPLTTTLATVDTTLDGIKTSEVMGGGTMAYLGVTWGRRMLASSWRTVWGNSDSVHPIDPAAREVTKVLILLTDGGNALEDQHSKLPGKLNAKHVGVPDCLDTGTRPPSCKQGDIGTFYSALGRLGPGAKAQGHYYAGWDVRGTTGAGPRTSETALAALMKRSCALARGEGVTVYTIGAMPSVHTRWRDALVACSGAPGTAEADRSGFYFHAADGASLDRAFRAIARRVISLRRVS